MNLSLNSWVFRWAESDGPGHSAAAVPEPPASLSADLFGRATEPIPATLVLSHNQFFKLLPEHLVLHQLESQRPHCDFVQTLSLATAA